MPQGDRLRVGSGEEHTTRRCRGVIYPKSYITKYTTYTKRKKVSRDEPVLNWPGEEVERPFLIDYPMVLIDYPIILIDSAISTCLDLTEG